MVLVATDELGTLATGDWSSKTTRQVLVCMCSVTTNMLPATMRGGDLEEGLDALEK